MSASALEVIGHAPYNAESPAEMLREPITPTASVYVRSNFAIPSLGDDHTIELVDGAETRTLPVEALRAMAQRTVTITMECAGNDRLGMHPLPTGEPWRHGAISTARWTGVPLTDVLRHVTLPAATTEIEVAGADHGPRVDAIGDVRFARGVPLADAMHPDTLLALAMNDEPLSPEHGAPVRLVVPGWYGMTNVKWVSRIAARVTPYDGYFQRQRYVFDTGDAVTPVSRMRVKSMIASPPDGARVGRHVEIRGWAWSGNGPVLRIDVAVGGGDAWAHATLDAPAGPYAWTPWRCDVMLPHRGRFSVRSRATDASGATQPDVIEWNRLGYGNNAVRTVVIEAE